MTKISVLLTALCSAAVISGCSSKGDDSFYEKASVAAEGFCVEAMGQLMDVQLDVKNMLHEDIKSYTKSKAYIEPMTTHEFVRVGGEGDDAKLQGVPMTISCKYKSDDALTEFLKQPVTRKQCGEINANTLVTVRQQLQAEGITPTVELIMDEDESAWMGPLYIKPWPYQAAYSENGDTHVRAKELYVSKDSMMPLPDKFKGNHYCHFIAPEYARVLLTGEVNAPQLAD